MSKITIFVIQLLVIFALVVFFISNAFIVSFDIGDFKYLFSSNILLGFLIFLVFLIYLLQFVFFKTRFAIHKFIINKKMKRLEKGYSFFVDAMIAVANKDNKRAIISNKKMLGYLNNDPTLSLLLEAEVLKIEKKYDKLKSIYEEMLKRKNTETLGYRGLMEYNLQNQDFHHAFIYGEKLFLLNPKIEKLYETMVHIIAKTNNWNQLLSISEQAYSHRIIDKEVLNENKSIAYYEIAKIKMHNDSKESIKLILKALSLKKLFPPYIKLYLEILFINNDISQAKKIIKKYWFEKPSLLLRNIITKLIKEYNLDELQFIKSIVDKNLNNEESKKFLIEFAIRLQKWELARANIKGLIGANPTKEVCLFMADIEIGEYNDKQKSDAWKLRSNNAKLNNFWICKITNETQDNWTALSDSGYFNSLEWKQPKMLNQSINLI